MKKRKIIEMQFAILANICKLFQEKINTLINLIEFHKMSMEKNKRKQINKLPEKNIRNISE